MRRYLYLIGLLFLFMCIYAVASDANKPPVSTPISNEDNASYIAKLKKAAETGDANSQFMLGEMYRTGKDVVRDNNEALKWYRKAAEQDYPSAQYWLGWMYILTARDYQEAHKWFRKSAERDFVDAQSILGNICEDNQDYREAIKWYTKAAEKGNVPAQVNLGFMYCVGEGITQDYQEAFKWFKKASEQGYVGAQYMLGSMFENGDGVEQDYKEAVKWYHKAAEQGDAQAQFNLGQMYRQGNGVIEDYVEAYKWYLLAGMNGHDVSKQKESLQTRMTPEQIAEAQKRAKEFVAKKELAANSDTPFTMPSITEQPKIAGTGFFVDRAGYIVTAYHVIDGAKRIKIKTALGIVAASVLFGDAATDIAILKVEGNDFVALPLVASSTVKTGDKICTIGYPNIQMQGQEPKYTEGVISSLSGPSNNPRYFQISVPVQPGNSGGPLVNEQGYVVGVITAQLNDAAAISETGAIPQNVNYAVKSAFVLPFLENIPELKAATKPASKDRAEVIEQMKKATVLVICY